MKVQSRRAWKATTSHSDQLLARDCNHCNDCRFDTLARCRVETARDYAKKPNSPHLPALPCLPAFDRWLRGEHPLLMKPPAFQFYADDFIGGTTTMTTTEVGAYILLLCHQWSAGEIPNDERRLFAITRSNNEADNEAAVRYVVAEKFSLCEDGTLRNLRMESVRTINKEFKKKSSNGGKASAAKRCGDSEWGKRMAAQRTANEAGTEPTNEPTSEAATNSPSPSPSPCNNKKARKVKVEMSDQEWMTDLKSKPENQGINVDAEYSKACEWCRKNDRTPSRRFFSNWLAKAAQDKPLAIVAKKPYQNITHTAPSGGYRSCL